MFGYCIWYSIEYNLLTEAMKKISNYLKIKPHKPHITYKSCMNKDDSKKEYLNIKDKDICIFIKKGKPYQTKTNNFFALQQDYSKLNNDNKEYHISLAYKINNEFTEDEINFSKKINIPEIIDTKYITFQRWWCDTPNYHKWRLLDF